MNHSRPEDKLAKVVSLAKRRGYVFPTSEIYGGLASSYDYGPMGAELLRNIRNLWWDRFITKRSDMLGLDSQIILHPQTWIASGHVSSFTDPMVEDKVTHKRYRADHLIEDWISTSGDPKFEEIIVENLESQEMDAFIKEHQIKSPEGNEITEVMDFKLLFETELGSVQGKKTTAYLRGETAQGIFTNFKNILDSTRAKLPFGVGQIGKSFRNEITTGQFIFRTLEFEQAEIEYFFNPAETEWKTLFQDWKEQMENFATNAIGINKNNLRWRQHTDKERSFYSKDTWDLEYNYPFGWKELWGIAYRTDYDLKQHEKESGEELQYQDPYTGKRFTPHVIEPAVGIDRIALMALCEAYTEETENKRIVLKLNPALAPYKVAVFPLVRNKEQLVKKAKEVLDMVSPHFSATWDDRGNIGKRYYAQDEIGTPFCVTVDYDTVEKGIVTVRSRDTMQQQSIPVTNLVEYIEKSIQVI